MQLPVLLPGGIDLEYLQRKDGGDPGVTPIHGALWADTICTDRANPGGVIHIYPVMVC